MSDLFCETSFPFSELARINTRWVAVRAWAEKFFSQSVVDKNAKGNGASGAVSHPPPLAATVPASVPAPVPVDSAPAPAPAPAPVTVNATGATVTDTAVVDLQHIELSAETTPAATTSSVAPPADLQDDSVEQVSAQDEAIRNEEQFGLFEPNSDLPDQAGLLIVHDPSAQPFSRGDWRSIVSTHPPQLSSKESKAEIVVDNQLPWRILFCWVGRDGKLHHFRPLDNGTKRTHTEFCSVNHSFVGLRETLTGGEKPVNIQDIHPDDLVFLYQALLGNHVHTLHLSTTSASTVAPSEIVISCNLTCHEKNDAVISSAPAPAPAPAPAQLAPPADLQDDSVEQVSAQDEAVRNEEQFGLFEPNSDLPDQAGLLIVHDPSAQPFSRGDWRSIVSTHPPQLSSKESKAEIVVDNHLPWRILFCWVGNDGKLHHFTPVDNGSIQDLSVKSTHTEFCSVNHTFVGLRETLTGGEKPVNIQDIHPDDFVFLYQALLGNHVHTLHLSTTSASTVASSEIVISCNLTCHEKNDAVISSVDKPYLETNIQGFTVFFEPDVFDEFPALRQAVEEELAVVMQRLPAHAASRVREDTPLWINKTLTYGPAAEPIVGKGCTYHPGADWLVSNGCTAQKHRSVEMYDAAYHLQSRDLWGLGGILVHEFCHAYHNKFCPDGYSNETILTAYNVAMEKRLYDSVPVHGSQGANGPVKAYACTNCMEFFAELSVAYHYHEDEETEYNKWYPHNRAQIRQHDPDTLAMLEKMWTEPLAS